MRKEREGLYEQALEADLAVKLLKVTDDEDARIGAAVDAQMEIDPRRRTFGNGCWTSRHA